MALTFTRVLTSGGVVVCERHLAAQADVGTSVERPSFDADVNVVGTVRVLEAARAATARVVFASKARSTASASNPPGRTAG
jgi:nucleoside-diphosphate-sugar epimerase